MSKFYYLLKFNKVHKILYSQKNAVSLNTVCIDSISYYLFSELKRYYYKTEYKFIKNINKCTPVNNFIKKNIIKKSISFGNDIFLTRVISDFEECCGMSSILVLRYYNNNILTTNEKLFKILLIMRFLTEAAAYNIDINKFINIFFIFIYTKDIDIFLNNLTSIFEYNFFGNFRSILQFLNKFFFFFWNVMQRNYGFIGIKLIVAGKLGKKLLTRGNIVKIQYGITTSGRNNIKVLFRYRVASLYIGLFGISLYIYYN